MAGLGGPLCHPPGLTRRPAYTGAQCTAPPGPPDLDDERRWPSLSGQARAPLTPPRAGGGAQASTWWPILRNEALWRVLCTLCLAVDCARPPELPWAVAQVVGTVGRPGSPDGLQGREGASKGRGIEERPRSK